MRPRGAPSLWKLTALLTALLALAPGPLPSVRAADPAPTDELVRLARALRANPTAVNYQKLARYAADSKDAELTAEAAFALGVCDFEQKRWAEARERLRAAAAGAWLGDYAAYYRARVEAEAGNPAAALQALREIRLVGSPVEEPVRVLEADLLVRTGQTGEAVSRLLLDPQLWQRPARLFALARAQRAAGDPIAAAETLNHIYYNFPLSPQAELANQVLSELRVELRANYPAPSEALRRSRAEKLWVLRAFRGARSDYLDLSVRAGEPLRTEARVRAAVALFQLGDTRVGCDELTRIPAVTGTIEAEYRSYRVRCDLRGGGSPRAEADLEFLEKNFAGSEPTQDALLAAANAAVAAGDEPRARAMYRRLVESAGPGRATADAHWKLAWLDYRAGDRPAAARRMEEHLVRYSESRYLPRALYWRARIGAAAGEESLAERLLALLHTWAPRDYLAQEARKLERALKGAPAGDNDTSPAWLEGFSERPPRATPPDLPPVQTEFLGKAEALERLGLWDLSSQALDAALELGSHPDISLAQARLALVQGKFARATEILNREHQGYWHYRLEELPRAAWEILFPRPYWSLIERESHRQGVDPYLVAALIRQESRFEAEAVSSAGALGLMQIMPRTAAALSGQELSRRTILTPEVNIRLGTRYLAQLLQRYNGSLEMAVAAYNAGTTRLGQWTAVGYRELPEFVESIPIEQTREFVHIILRNYRFYRDLYSPDDTRPLAATADESGESDK